MPDYSPRTHTPPRAASTASILQSARPSAPDSPPWAALPRPSPPASTPCPESGAGSRKLATPSCPARSSAPALSPPIASGSAAPPPRPTAGVPSLPLQRPHSSKRLGCISSGHPATTASVPIANHPPWAEKLHPSHLSSPGCRITC
jgi:hypothetical protein